MDARRGECSSAIMGNVQPGTAIHLQVHASYYLTFLKNAWPPSTVLRRSSDWTSQSSARFVSDVALFHPTSQKFLKKNLARSYQFTRMHWAVDCLSHIHRSLSLLVPRMQKRRTKARYSIVRPEMPNDGQALIGLKEKPFFIM